MNASTTRERLKMNITESVKIALEIRSLNQRELADLMNMSEAAMSNLMRRNSISLRKLNQIAKALNMKTSELIKLSEEVDDIKIDKDEVDDLVNRLNFSEEDVIELIKRKNVIAIKSRMNI